MTGLENIIKQIEADSQSRIDEIKSKADAAVRDIMGAANAEAEEISRYISEYQLCLNVQQLGSWVRHSPRKEYSHTQSVTFTYLRH